MAVPCGTYLVKVSVGDSNFQSGSTAGSTHRINVEGVNAINNFAPTNSNRFATATRNVVVCDGRLTIDATGGGSNTKLNYAEVHRTDPKINFQRTQDNLPFGYAKDTGVPYSDTRGHGWVRQDSLTANTHVPLDLSLNTRDRDIPDTDPYDQRLDTLIFMQSTNPVATQTPGAWEMAVPCGSYQVTVTVGDANYSSGGTGNFSNHRINVEGVNAIAGFVPTDSNKFANATRTVQVCDGRLTIDAVGGTNTKLNYVNITPVG